MEKWGFVGIDVNKLLVMLVICMSDGHMISDGLVSWH